MGYDKDREERLKKPADDFPLLRFCEYGIPLAVYAVTIFKNPRDADLVYILSTLLIAYAWVHLTLSTQLGRKIGVAGYDFLHNLLYLPILRGNYSFINAIN